ncbi:MAG: AlpA family transcriptional regulator [Pseudomonas sp.]|nr:AlpA family transcriptional regulator [Pseudomonas sp.]
MKIIRLKEVILLTGLARSTVYKFIKAQEFPKQVSLGGRSVGWIESEIEAWIVEKIEARDK